MELTSTCPSEKDHPIDRPFSPLTTLSKSLFFSTCVRERDPTLRTSCSPASGVRETRLARDGQGSWPARLTCPSLEAVVIVACESRQLSPIALLFPTSCCSHPHPHRASLNHSDRVIHCECCRWQLIESFEFSKFGGRPWFDSSQIMCEGGCAVGRVLDFPLR